MTRTRSLRLRLGLVALAAALMVAGCSRRDHDGDTATTPTVLAPTTTTVETTTEPVTTTTTVPSEVAASSTTTTTILPTAATSTTPAPAGPADLSAELDAVEAALTGLDALDAEAGDAVSQTDAALAHDDSSS